MAQDHSTALALMTLCEMAIEQTPADASIDAHLLSMVNTLQDPARRSEMRRRMIDGSARKEQMEERIKQFDKGFADAIEKTVLLLTIAIDTYPRMPGEKAVTLIMDPVLAQLILDCLPTFEKRLKDMAAREIEQVKSL